MDKERLIFLNNAIPIYPIYFLGILLNRWLYNQCYVSLKATTTLIFRTIGNP